MTRKPTATDRSAAGPPRALRIEDVPEPPWRASAKAPPAPRVPLTVDTIVEAAGRVLDREGMDGLSMRKVAEELGTGAGSLYGHVRNKEALLQLLFERVVEEIELPEPDPSRWQEQLKRMAREMRLVMNRHRDSARLSLGRIPAGATLVLVSEWYFELLRPVGMPDRVIAYLGDLLALYVGAYAFEETLGLASPTGEDLSPEEIGALLRDYVVSLPADRFPHTRGAVDLLMGGGRDERFEYGLDIIVRGLESFVPPARRLT
ncbi:MAG TPA: TetR/AcrR family transcriptional regulator [Acidimicrobiales bacterium]